MAKATKGASHSTSTETSRSESKMVKKIQYPSVPAIYGGNIRMLDGRIASIYSSIGPEGVEIMEVQMLDEDKMLTPEQLSQIVSIGDRKITLQEYIVEEILPHYYEKAKK